MDSLDAARFDFQLFDLPMPSVGLGGLDGMLSEHTASNTSKSTCERNSSRARSQFRFNVHVSFHAPCTIIKTNTEMRLFPVKIDASKYDDVDLFLNLIKS